MSEPRRITCYVSLEHSEAFNAIIGATLSPLSPPAPSGVEEADARPPADPPRPVAGKPDDDCRATTGL